MNLVNSINSKNYFVEDFERDVRQNELFGYELYEGRIVRKKNMSIEVQLKIKGRYVEEYVVLFYKDLNEALDYNDSGFMAINDLPLYVGKEIKFKMSQDLQLGENYYGGKALNENGFFYDLDKIESDMDEIKTKIEEDGFLNQTGIVIRKERLISQPKEGTKEFILLESVLKYLHEYSLKIPAHQYKAVLTLMKPYISFLETGKYDAYDVLTSKDTITSLLKMHNEKGALSLNNTIKNFNKICNLMISNGVQTFVSLIDYPGVNMAMNNVSSRVGDIVNVKITAITPEGKLRGVALGGNFYIPSSQDNLVMWSSKDSRNVESFMRLSKSQRDIILENFIVPADFESFKSLYGEIEEDLGYLIDEANIYREITVLNGYNLEAYYVYNELAYNYAYQNNIDKISGYKYEQGYVGFLEVISSVQCYPTKFKRNYKVNPLREKYKGIYDNKRRHELRTNAGQGQLVYFEESRNSIYDLFSTVFKFFNLNNMNVNLKKKIAKTKVGELEKLYFTINHLDLAGRAIQFYPDTMSVSILKFNNEPDAPISFSKIDNISVIMKPDRSELSLRGLLPKEIEIVMALHRIVDSITEKQEVY